jgi:hypothetical protein
MPVQINEIVVRVTVDEEQTASPAQGASAVPPSGGNPTSEELLEAVVEIIREKSER